MLGETTIFEIHSVARNVLRVMDTTKNMGNCGVYHQVPQTPLFKHENYCSRVSRVPGFFSLEGVSFRLPADRREIGIISRKKAIPGIP